MSDGVQLKNLRPILVVDAMEPSLGFWQRLGFVATVTVPDMPPFGFAILARGDAQVMLQTRESVTEDLGGAAGRVAASIVYVSVAALDPVIAALGDAPVAVPRRRTFYGADEIFVFDPAGHVIGFAAPT